MKELIDKVIQDNKETLDRLARHDSGEEIIDTSNIERAMNRQEKLTKIEAVIRECCPELQDKETIIAGTVVLTREPEIDLENILRAIQQKESNDIFFSISGNVIANGEQVAVFDLTKPYHLQSDEFISWLYGVLVGE